MMLPQDDPLPSTETNCEKCGYAFNPGVMLGGLCPRCLLAGFHGNRHELTGAIELHNQPGSLEDDKLADELPEFELVEAIGRGGGGVVWKAKEKDLNRNVAIKLLRNQKRDVDFVERFAREAKVMARLNHPNIVGIYSFGRTLSQHCYLVMELVEGSHLGELMAKGPLDVSVALGIANDVGSALRQAHLAGCIHRDIKPSNILIDGNGRVKVADFGLARVFVGEGVTSITARGWVVGTPHYIAPEQAKGDGSEDHRADIYSMGVMLYQMLTGELPRGVFRPPSAKGSGDKRLDLIVMKSLQEDPADRYQSMDIFLADLKQLREAFDPGLKVQFEAAQHASRWRRRFEMGLAVGVSLVLGLVMADLVRGWLPIHSDKIYQTSPSMAGVTERDASKVVQGGGFVVSKKFKLQPQGLSSGSFFGRSVTVSDDWLAVGAPDDSSHFGGSVYLFERDVEKGWILRQVLSGDDEAGGTRFGYDVAMSGPYLVVAAPRRITATNQVGKVHMYGRSANGRWQKSAAPPFPMIESKVPGLDVQWLGNRLAVFDKDAENSVATIAVRELALRRNTWIALSPTTVNRTNPIEEIGGVPSSGASAGLSSEFECAVVSGAWAFVGWPSREKGGIEIFRRESGVLGFPPLFLEPEASDEASDFGASVAFSRQTLVIGAPSSGSSVDSAGTGAVFVYELAAPLP
jgi:serine/threonine protein kinase